MGTCSAWWLVWFVVDAFKIILTSKLICAERLEAGRAVCCWITLLCWWSICAAPTLYQQCSAVILLFCPWILIYCAATRNLCIWKAELTTAVGMAGANGCRGGGRQDWEINKLGRRKETAWKCAGWVLMCSCGLRYCCWRSSLSAQFQVPSSFPYSFNSVYRGLCWGRRTLLRLVGPCCRMCPRNLEIWVEKQLQAVGWAGSIHGWEILPFACNLHRFDAECWKQCCLTCFFIRLL